VSARLRVGRIPYLNLYPIFHVLDTECDTSHYEFVAGHPAELNRMLREGALDVSPSSSVEYLRGGRLYGLIEGHSISSRGAIGSIFLFSRLPLASLEGGEVCATSRSETSTALLRVILGRFLGLRCRVEATALPLEEALGRFGACLLIGDEAMAEAARPREGVEVHDLGSIWFEHTGLPFVFALWITRSGLAGEKRALLSSLRADLDRAKLRAAQGFEAMAASLGDRAPAGLTREGLVRYWKGITYGLGPEELKGLEAFGGYLREEGLL